MIIVGIDQIEVFINPTTTIRRMGRPVTYTCEVNEEYDNYPYKIQWTYNDSSLPFNAIVNKHSLTLNPVLPWNGGYYSCIVTRKNGHGTGLAKLEVYGKHLYT